MYWAVFRGAWLKVRAGGALEEPQEGPSWLEKAAPSTGTNKEVFLVAVERTEMSVVGLLIEQEEGEGETTRCLLVYNSAVSLRLSVL